MQIVSGLGRRTVMRLGFMFLLLAVFGAWFAFDGWVTYPRKNLEAARQALPRPVESLTAQAAVTEASSKGLTPAPGHDVTLQDLRKAWGEPAYLGPASATGTSAEQAAFFVGPYGYVRATLEGDQVRKLEWQHGPKVASDISVQRLLGLTLGAAALIPLVLLLVQMSGRYVLDDRGLTLPKSSPIPYDRMTGIDVTEFSTKGIVRLRYRDEAGRDATAVLDEEKIAKFEEIIAALCEKKNWPIEVEAEEPGGPSPA